MGSFIGHIDEATFFMVLGVWWLCNFFSQYHKNPEKYEGRLSYPLPCYRRVPIECIFKILFPLCGLVGELSNGKGPHFISESGQFQKLQGLQHITIYSIFALHGIIDLLTFFKVKLVPPGADYLSAALSFFWYGMAFVLHADMPGKSPLEKTVHMLPTKVMLLVGVLALAEYWKGGRFTFTLVRGWSLLLLGTWFFHTSFMMYQPWGGKANPDWDRYNHNNVHFAVAMFGFHCIMNVVIVWAFYVLFYFITPRHTSRDALKSCSANYVTLDECEILMEESGS